jgi:CheY-like chemotaxis protein
MIPRGKLIEILLVEDNPGDVRLTREALKEGKIRNTLSVARDGQEALDFLLEKETHPRPDVILLDLNLPRKNGLEVLDIIKKDEDLKKIPVVILTTSEDEKDILQSYELHANCYITKPVELQNFLEVMKCLQSFWLEIVKLPGTE